MPEWTVKTLFLHRTFFFWFIRQVLSNGFTIRFDLHWYLCSLVTERSSHNILCMYTPFPSLYVVYVMWTVKNNWELNILTKTNTSEVLIGINNLLAYDFKDFDTAGWCRYYETHQWVSHDSLPFAHMAFHSRPMVHIHGLNSAVTILSMWKWCGRERNRPLSG